MLRKLCRSDPFGLRAAIVRTLQTQEKWPQADFTDLGSAPWLILMRRPWLATVKKVFKAWHDFRGGGCTQDELQDRLWPVARRLNRLLEQGCACADDTVAQFCANLLDLGEALWLFMIEDDVEPTNNHAERVLRCGVLWRKNAFGCHSVQGCRFVERILSTVQTLRLQKRKVLKFLHETLHAHRAGKAAPALLLG